MANADKVATLERELECAKYAASGDALQKRHLQKCIAELKAQLEALKCEVKTPLAHEDTRGLKKDCDITSEYPAEPEVKPTPKTEPVKETDALKPAIMVTEKPIKETDPDTRAYGMRVAYLLLATRVAELRSAQKDVAYRDSEIDKCFENIIADNVATMNPYDMIGRVDLLQSRIKWAAEAATTVTHKREALMGALNEAMATAYNRR